MTDEEYIKKYEEKYGKLDKEGKEYVLDCYHKFENMTNEEYNEFINILKEFQNFKISSKNTETLD